MLNYVHAEFYKVFRRKYPFVMFGIMAALAALLCGGFIFINSNDAHVEFYEGGTTGVSMLAVGLYAAIMVGDMVFSDQYKFNTLKNEVSFGIPRARIYFGKLAVEMVMGVALSVLLMGFYEVMCYFTLIPSSPEETEAAWIIVGWCVLAALPQWLGSLALTNMLFFLLRSNTVAAILAVGIIAVPATVLQLTALFLARTVPNVAEALLVLRDCLPGEIIGAAGNSVGDWAFMAKSWGLGALWMVACTAVGLVGFQKKEIA